MKFYDTFQKANEENPNSKIVTTGPKWDGEPIYLGKFSALIKPEDCGFDGYHNLSDNAWVICNPEDYEEKQQWSGEGYPPIGIECEIATNEYDDWSKCFVKFVGDDICVVSFNGCEESRILRLVKFRPLETPEQKKEREELEAAYDLFLTFYQGINVSFEEFSASYDTEDWIRIVRKTNYTPSDTMNS
jgi:hypothetical protein